MSILITGANGLLGQKLVRLLLHKGEKFVATGLGGCRIPLSGIRYRTMDITWPGEVLAVLQQEQPEVVIHTAAMTQVDQCEIEQAACWRLNVTAVENLVDACRQTGAFLVHLSTDFIFDGTNGPYTEDAEPNPLSYYGESKLAAERIVSSTSLRWAIVRTVLVYGIAHDMSRSNIILWTKKNLEQGKPIRVVTDQWRTPTLAEDLAMGCYQIAEKRAGGIFNIAGKDFMRPYDMAMAAAQYFGLDKSLISPTDAASFVEPARRPLKTGLVIDKARTLLGYEPHSFKEGIEVVARQLAV